MTHIYATFNLSVHWRHDITDLEANTAHFDQVFFLQPIARNVHIRTASVSYHAPDLFFWLLLEDLVYTFVYVVFVKDPVGAVLVH